MQSVCGARLNNALHALTLLQDTASALTDMAQTTGLYEFLFTDSMQVYPLARLA